MFYREAGQYKTSYAADQAIFPVLQDRLGLIAILSLLSWSSRSQETSFCCRR